MNTLPLSSSQLTTLAVGVCLAIVVYLMYRIIRKRLRRAATSEYAPKMRPRGTSTPRAEFDAPIAPSPSLAVEHPQPQPAPATPLASAEVEAPLAAANGENRRLANYWPVEPKTVVKRNLFEDVGEEYPYADGTDYAFGGLTPAMAVLLPASEDNRRDFTKTLRNAGYYTPHAWHNFAAVRYLGLMLPILVLGALLVIVPEALEPAVMIGLIIVPIFGWALPALYVRGQATERLHEIENAMPDMLDLLNMCVSQGMTVPAALGRVGRELGPVYPALSKELNIVTEQSRVGNLAQALTNFSERVDVPDVHAFSSLLTQTEQMGTSVSEALSDYSDGMRENMRQRADEKANSAAFKLLFPTVLCLMPAVFLFLMGPALIELNKFFDAGGIQALNNGVGTTTRAAATPNDL